MLSVVVTIVDGGPALERCLAALAAQQEAPVLEVLVPWDESVTGIADFARRHPSFTFLPLGRLETARPLHSPAGQHELFDRRRAAGLGRATGALVAILEDRGVPRPDWARTVVARHAALPHAVIGGAIENGVPAAWNFAVYCCDFGRYQLPFEAGPRAYVSDVNVCYKRPALEQTRDLWRERYHETTVHWALQRSGETLYLDPGFVVEQHREGLTLGGLLAERIGWGRLFAHTRAREVSPTRRVVHALTAPVVPFLLFFRLLRDQHAKGVTLGRFLAVSPLVVVLLAAWCWGEFLGYLTGRA